MVTKLKVVTVFMIGVLMLLAVGNESTRAENLLASGKFVTIADHTTLGTVEIFQKDNRTYVRLADDFSTQNGPDLKVLLHKQNRPQSYDQGDYVLLGNLKNLNGAQVYEIPAGVVLDDYSSVVVWCQKFNVTFGTAKPKKIGGTKPSGVYGY